MILLIVFLGRAKPFPPKFSPPRRPNASWARKSKLNMPPGLVSILNRLRPETPSLGRKLAKLEVSGIPERYTL